MSTHRASSSWLRALARRPAALVAFVAFVSFVPTLAGGFVYDDTLLISENVRVQRWHGLIEAFTTHFWATDALFVPEATLVYYRPLVTLSFVLDWQLFDGSPWGFHLVNVLLHATAAWLATRLCLRWLGRAGLAVAIGVLFAVHPTRSESVAWIAGRTDLAMAVFVLLSLEAARRARFATRPRRGAELSTLLAFVAALACKEGAFVLPLLLWADMRLDEPAGLSRASRRLLSMSAALAAAYLATRVFVYPVRVSASAFDLRYGLVTVATYAERLVWPFPQTFFYRSLSGGPEGLHYPQGLVLLGGALCVGYLALVVGAWRRHPAASLCLLSAAAFIAPVLNFFETGIKVTVSDHFLYLPLLLLALGVARLCVVELGAVRDRVWLSLAAVFALLCAVPNTARAAHFLDDRALWQHELSVDPSLPPALEWSSVELARRGDLRGALSQLERALSPASMRHALLNRRALANGRFLRAVELTAALTPDGDRRALSLLYAELASFWSGKPAAPAKVGWLELGRDRDQAGSARRFSPRARALLAAELAVLASRLGEREETLAWARRVPREELAFLPNPLNFVLALARADDLAAARGVVAALEVARGERLAPQALPELSARLGRAEQARTLSRQAPASERAMHEALAELELGAYLSACRRLRPEYLRTPERQEVAQLYAQALTAARLEQEAGRVVAAALGRAEAPAVQAALKAALSPFLRDLPAAPDSPAWWAE
jgi:protein O-mannosyl-transferase